MLFRNCLDQQGIIRAAAVLQQNSKDLPNVSNNRVLLLCMRHNLLQQLIEANRIDEERPVNAIDIRWVDVCFVQGWAIDAVASDRQLVFWCQNYTWDVEMLGVLERFVDPVLENFGAHLDLTIFWSKAGRFSVCWVSTFNWRDGSVFTTLVLLWAEFERVTIEEGSAILAVHLLTKLLGDDWDVLEASEWGSFGTFVDRWKRKTWSQFWLDMHRFIYTAG